MVLGILGFCLTSGSDREITRFQALDQLVVQSAQNWHFSPKEMDDQFSKDLFALYSKQLDPSKRFFLASDIESLKTHETLLDDELEQGRCDFSQKARAILNKRVDWVKTVYKHYLSQPVPFDSTASVELRADKLPYCSSLEALADRWRNILLYETLLVYMDLDTTKKAGTSSQNLERQARAKVLKQFDRQFRLVSEITTADETAAYVNAIANTFDPHTDFMPADIKEDFDIDLSGTLEGIGAVLQDDFGQVKVASIVPGSAAWRQQGLKAGDLILKVAQDNQDPIEVAGMRLRDVVKMIRGKKGTKVILSVQKPDGHLVKIPIVRDIVIIEDAYVKALTIVDPKTHVKLGYVSLPSFYHDFNKSIGRSAAQDMAKALKNLSKTDIQGMILDLRENSGGALDDAIKVSGLFIPSGPVVQVRDRNKKSVLADQDPEVAYKGPLVVLINGISASASEILAAALQDYGRSVIVGPSSSFGKGTVQTFVNLDDVLSNSYGYLKPIGSLKLTIQKFYRVTGGSTQFMGVSPDILLPDTYGYADISEKSLTYSLPWDTVLPAHFDKKERFASLEALRQAVSTQFDHDDAYQILAKEASRIAQDRKKSLSPLALTHLVKIRKGLQTEAKKIELFQKKMQNLNPVYLKIDDTSSPNESAKKAYLDRISKDFYVGACVEILREMISMGGWQD